MTQHERNKIDQLVELIEDTVIPEIESIKRGIYGDEKNHIPGLMKMREEDHARLKKLENLRDRILWIGSALIICTQMLWDYVKAKVFGA